MAFVRDNAATYRDDFTAHHQPERAPSLADFSKLVDKAQEIAEKQAFALNPSITGAKVEETCIASADGVEVITSTPSRPQVCVSVEGRDYFSPDALSL